MKTTLEIIKDSVRAAKNEGRQILYLSRPLNDDKRYNEGYLILDALERTLEEDKNLVLNPAKFGINDQEEFEVARHELVAMSDILVIVRNDRMKSPEHTDWVKLEMEIIIKAGGSVL